MTKEQIRTHLLQGKHLDEFLTLMNGLDCRIYKANKFEISDQVIYIPDVESNNICPIHWKLADLQKNEIEEALSHMYTGEEFLTECFGNERFARDVFKYVDWQHPCSVTCEAEWGMDDREMQQYYGFTWEELERGEGKFRMDDPNNYTIEYCPHCDSEVAIYSRGITACPNCDERLAPCSICDDCIEKCPYYCDPGCDCDESIEHWPTQTISDEEVELVWEQERKLMHPSKRYEFYVKLCGGYANGTISIDARSQEQAHQKIEDIVVDKLCKAFPDLEIEYDVELKED